MLKQDDKRSAHTCENSLCQNRHWENVFMQNATFGSVYVR